MVRPSNFLVGLLNAILMTASLVAVGYSVYLYARGSTACERSIQMPLLVTGSTLFAVSTLGLIGACYRSNFSLVLYLSIVLLAILGMVAFIVFAFLVTQRKAGDALSGKAFDFSNWLRDHFASGDSWRRIRYCLAESDVCKGVADGGFYGKHMSLIREGCCRPPEECGSSLAAADRDCRTWSKEQSRLCFYCEACKDGVVANIKRDWWRLLVLNACLLFVLIIVYSLGCCALRNNKTQKKRHRYDPHPRYDGA